MILDGKIDLDVPVKRAWDFLIDINKFSTCLPGIDEIRQIDDKTFEGLISASVGPISGKFNFRSTIAEINRRHEKSPGGKSTSVFFPLS